MISLKNDTYNNNNSLLEYRDFYKLYFQLFSSTLGIACIYRNKCITLAGIFIDKYLPESIEEFNYTLFILIQNQILSKQLLEKRSYLNNIHKCIGNEKYNILFGKEINYYKVSQNIYNKRVIFNLTSVKVEFSEAILIICNSFQILNKSTITPSQPIFLGLFNNECGTIVFISNLSFIIGLQGENLIHPAKII